MDADVIPYGFSYAGSDIHPFGYPYVFDLLATGGAIGFPSAGFALSLLPHAGGGLPAAVLRSAA